MRVSQARLAVLASGEGSNLQAILDACARGELAAEVVGVFSDRTTAGAVARAQRAGVPAMILRPRDYPDRACFDAALFAAVAAARPDWIVCAGYMRLIGAAQVRTNAGRMINLHPSLLPAFKGLDTHRRALAAGVTEHGASVHCVTADLDGGPVLAQARVPVLPEDSPESLAARVRGVEHPLLVGTLAALIAGDLRCPCEPG